jgi:virginiamycin A acetyltransferase
LPTTITFTVEHLNILKKFRIFTRYHPSFEHYLANNASGWLKVGARLTFHNQIELEPYSAPYSSPYIGGKGRVASHGLCSMGSQSYTYSALPEQMQVGRYCSIGEGLTILDSNHPIERVSTSHFTWKPVSAFVEAARVDRGTAFSEKPLFRLSGNKPYPKVGSDVWIGQNCTLLMGITIGDGAIVAANSTVTKSVPPFAIVGGCPAKHIKYRFADDQREQLMQIRWWDYLFTDFDHLPMDNIPIFLQHWKKECSSFKLYKPTKLVLPDALL